MELVEREREILQILEKLKSIDFILVGGYAVSSLTMHRYSVDCDMVVSKSLEKIKSMIKKDGYSLKTKRSGFDKIYGSRFESYAKKINKTSVNIDLLINGLTSRGTDASWSFGYIKRHSIESQIGTPPVRCSVPEKELLMAMKIHSARKADIRDIIMLREGCDLEKVLGHVKRGNLQQLGKKINKILNSLDDEKLVDSLKGAFRLQKDVQTDIKKTKSLVNKIRSQLFPSERSA